jgi:LytS/YehU family sensor histidine kinase
MAQMQPHFLFNSLNSLMELIATHQTTKAQEFTLKLSRLYRQVLETSENELAGLKDELQVLRAYLEIEQIRFGERLNFTMTVAPQAEEVRVPSILLQPLVENAVKHGIAKSLHGGEIKIDVVGDSRTVTIRIQNTGASLEQPIVFGSGLRNCVSRLGLLYGDSHQFRISENSMGQTEVSFTLHLGEVTSV